jgi:hypothetical protein
MQQSSEYQLMLQRITKKGFDWNYLHLYFPYSDRWSEGEYETLLQESLLTIQSPDAKKDLLGMLDLQYAVLLEQMAIKEYRLNELGVKIIKGIYETEASGGIQFDNLESYAATGVDYISSGAIIHQAKSLDLSLKAVLIG